VDDDIYEIGLFVMKKLQVLQSVNIV